MNKNLKIVAFNGPPGSGKDAAADMLAEAFPKCMKITIADILREWTAFIIGQPSDVCYARDTKDVPFEGLGRSPRDILIALARFGQAEFGMTPGWWANQALSRVTDDVEFLIVTDLGFQEEVTELEAAGDLHVIQLSRWGSDFSKDSRRYVREIEDPTVIHNQGTLDELREAVLTSLPWSGSKL